MVRSRVFLVKVARRPGKVFDGGPEWGDKPLAPGKYGIGCSLTGLSRLL